METKKRSRTKYSLKRRGYRRATAVRIILIIWSVLSVVILLAILFAPHHPPSPPPSEITYAQRPNRHSDPETKDSDITPSETSTDVDSRNTVPKQGKYRIFGTITDDTTGQPLYNAAIGATYVMSDEEAKRGTSGIRSSCASRNDGTYEMRVDKPGKYLLKAATPGYLTVDGIEIELDNDAPDVRYDFVMSRGASISGRVMVAAKGIGA
ncbi:MAG: carboxypeptidase regulatory-like domain-containing protein, partial [Candidatus Hydrogenedentes bacterium]|nr:carboxypeptidase regulatory-like domain-containing protein [Candidatus Hydrogenedentota bacterium]